MRTYEKSVTGKQLLVYYDVLHVTSPLSYLGQTRTIQLKTRHSDSLYIATHQSIRGSASIAFARRSGYESRVRL
jgi:hypothetical protein